MCWKRPRKKYSPDARSRELRYDSQRNGGSFFTEQVSVRRSTILKLTDPDLSFEYSGKSANLAQFEYSGPLEIQKYLNERPVSFALARFIGDKTDTNESPDSEIWAFICEERRVDDLPARKVGPGQQFSMRGRSLNS